MSINLEVSEKGYGVRKNVQSDLATHVLAEGVREGWISEDRVRKSVSSKHAQLSQEIYVGLYARSHDVSLQLARQEVNRAREIIEENIHSARAHLTHGSPVQKTLGRLGTHLRRLVHG
jgi:hypothetical protein